MNKARVKMPMVATGLCVADILARTPARPMLTPVEVAAAMGVPVEKVRGFIECGALPAIRIGSGESREHYRIERNTFSRFLVGLACAGGVGKGGAA